MICLYKIIEVFVKRKERMKIIEKIDFTQEANVNVEQILGRKDSMNLDKRAALWGSLLGGIGLGLIVGYIIAQVVGLYCKGNSYNHVSSQISIIYTSCTLIFGGAGLLISNYITNKRGKNDSE